MDDTHLGPAIARLGPLTQTAPGKLLIGVNIGAITVSALFIGLGIVLLLFLGIDALPSVVPVVLALVFAIPGLVLLTVAVLGLIYTRKVDITFHEHGVTLHQSWWRTRRVLWAEVAALIPPAPGSHFPVFDGVLHSGHKVRFERLQLKTPMDAYGRAVYHPDVQRTLNAHAQWWQKYAA